MTGVDQDTSHRLQKSFQRCMAGMSKTKRSINSRDTNRLFALHTSQDGRSPHVFKLQSAESVVEGQDAKVGWQSLMGEGDGCEVRRSGNFGAFADNLSRSRERRYDAIACLPDGDGGLGVIRELPKAYRLPVEGARGGVDEDTAALARFQFESDAPCLRGLARSREGSDS